MKKQFAYSGLSTHKGKGNGVNLKKLTVQELVAGIHGAKIGFSDEMFDESDSQFIINIDRRIMKLRVAELLAELKTRVVSDDPLSS